MVAQHESVFLYRNSGNALDPCWEVPVPVFLSDFDADVANYFILIDIDEDKDLDLFSSQNYSEGFYENVGGEFAPWWERAETEWLRLVPNRYGLAPSFADVDDDGDFTSSGNGSL